MKAIFYCILDEYEGDSFAYATLKEAKAARDLYETGRRPEIRRYETPDMPKRDLITAIYNRSQFATKQDVVVKADNDIEQGNV